LTITVVLHLPNVEPIVGELDDIPNPSDTLIVLNHPHTKDGKDLSNISEQTGSIVYPMGQIIFIEIVSGKDDEEIIGFVRE
jgi:hypothetical protein